MEVLSRPSERSDWGDIYSDDIDGIRATRLSELTKEVNVERERRRKEEIQEQNPEVLQH